MMKKSTLKFKMPFVNNFSSQISTQLTEVINDSQALIKAVKALNVSVQELQQQRPLIDRVINDVQSDVNQWKQKCDPIVIKLQDLLKQLEH